MMLVQDGADLLNLDLQDGADLLNLDLLDLLEGLELLDLLHRAARGEHGVKHRVERASQVRQEVQYSAAPCCRAGRWWARGRVRPAPPG